MKTSFDFGRPWALGAVFLAACGGGDADSSGATEGHLVRFHAAQTPFAGFGYDTGNQPEASPVQVRFVVAAEGGTTVDAQAVASGSDAAHGVPGSGNFVLDGAFTVRATLKVDLGPLQFDGPLEGAPDIRIVLHDAAPFEPFLIGGQVSVAAVVPATEVAAIPLQATAGIPGTLHLSASGTVTSDFIGACAGATAAGVEYVGETRTGGTLVLTATVDIDVPLRGTETFGPFVLPEIPIPPFTAPVDFGTQPGQEVAPIPNGPAAQPGTCVGADDPDGGSGGTHGGQGGGDGGGHGGATSGDARPSDDGGLSPPSDAGAGTDGRAPGTDARGPDADGGVAPPADPALVGQACDACPGNPCFDTGGAGLCTYDCTNDEAACGEDAACLLAADGLSLCFVGCVPRLGDNACAGPGTACDIAGVCLPACTADADCNAEDAPRTSYCNLDLGTCLPVGTPGARVGDPCDDETQCPRNGVCLTAFEGGRCSLQGCDLGGAFTCPQEYLCVAAAQGATPDAIVSLCLPSCQDDSTCGVGEVCLDTGDGLFVCAPPG